MLIGLSANLSENMKSSKNSKVCGFLLNIADISEKMSMSAKNYDVTNIDINHAKFQWPGKSLSSVMLDNIT